MSGFTPANQIRLTNVAAVRLQKKGRRFEIACYRNKVLSWRNKLESDLKEVLQIDTVFTNVSKGMLASSKDLMEAFGTSDQMLVCKEILDKGEIQVSEQERVALHETVFRDIASIVAEKTVNPNNNLPYTITMIQNAMRQVQFSVNVSKTSKSQALDVIRKLKDIIPIARASMLIRVIYLVADESVICGELDKIGGQIMQRSATVDASTKSSSTLECFVDAKIDPEYYRRMEDFVRALSVGRVEVIQMRMSGSVVPGGGAVGGSSSGIQAAHSTTSASDGKEGEDVFPQGEAPVASAAKTTSKGKEKEKEKAGGKRAGGRGGSSGKDLEGLLAAITGQNLHDEEDMGSGSDPEYAVVNNSGKNKKKQKKNKVKQPIVPIVEDSDEEYEEDHVEKIDNQDVPNSTTKAIRDEEDDTAMSIAPSVAETITSAASSSASGPVRQKIGKKEKRLEKELQKEREDQARALQRRLQRQQQEQQLQLQQQAAAAAQAAAEQIANAAETDATTASSAAVVSAPATISSSSGAAVGESAASAVGKVSSCNTCTGTFADSKMYREHFKSDWHRFNLKRKMKNLPAVTSEAEFLCLSVEELAL